MLLSTVAGPSIRERNARVVDCADLALPVGCVSGDPHHREKNLLRRDGNREPLPVVPIPAFRTATLGGTESLEPLLSCPA
jgi:hypothetical protein